MQHPAVIVISGLPASGKSILAARLHTRLRWPVLAKDDYKELLFERLGAADRVWSKRLSQASYALMFAEARRWLACGQPLIIEGNFRWSEQNAAFASLYSQVTHWVQIYCRAAPEVLIERYRDRARSRHPGHADIENAAEIEAELRSTEPEPLSLPGHIEVCDTTDDWSAAIDRTIARVVLRLQPENRPE